ncbi:MAG TPA: hypothetical protein VH112_04685 [Acidimicrobiales bacterium]|jgi:hypothetical protein|nr:hypothetical protein [Acidimicrobiales bacterium]
MVKRSPGKRVARAAATGGGRTKRGKAPIGFYTVLALIVVLGAATVGYSRYQRMHPASASTSSNKSSSPTTDPLKAPVLASTQAQANGQPVDGIACQTGEQLAYHIHAHIAVYSNGALRAVPRGIGITPPTTEQSSSEGPFIASGGCFYWLHSHTQDGVIHIESPTPKIYTLGNYFDIWQQPLSSTQVSTALGNVVAYVNGKQYKGDPRSIPLNAHAVIQLDVGSPTVPPKSFTFPQGL